ncbi:MAG: hypothetical protein KIT58_12780 [Planctomycetota bacterium]|nr:hypothetical protein [Planctomycetota bacterium]
MTRATPLSARTSPDQASPDRGPVDRLAALLAAGPATPRAELERRVLGEVAGFLDELKAAEARHVQLGLADPTFPFAAAIERLGGLRRLFAAMLRAALDVLGGRLAPAARAELERAAFLAEAAPLTTPEDLEAIRRARAARAAA